MIKSLNKNSYQVERSYVHISDSIKISCEEMKKIGEEFIYLLKSPNRIRYSQVKLKCYFKNQLFCHFKMLLYFPEKVLISPNIRKKPKSAIEQNIGKVSKVSESLVSYYVKIVMEEPQKVPENWIILRSTKLMGLNYKQ